ncbi:hypothetical protein [Anabaena sp. CCY 0017]|uniref:hypothetical protein n=1 Tax=Anabaena sp. CCY 0017 TaxID=3103866 RepID=UPI0039C6527A
MQSNAPAHKFLLSSGIPLTGNFLWLNLDIQRLASKPGRHLNMINLLEWASCRRVTQYSQHICKQLTNQPEIHRRLSAFIGG